MQVKVSSDFSTEELNILMAIGDKLGLSVVQLEKLTPIDYKIVRGVVTCVLCNTITTQYIKLIKYPIGVWVKEADITEEESKSYPLLKFEDYEARVKSCWNCETVLMEREKKDLVKMILKLLAPIPTQQDIWKYSMKLREEYHEKEMKIRKNLGV
jgi:hypothetical protein